MPKLSDIKMHPSPLRGKGIRPWNDLNVVKPSHKKEAVKREQSVSKALAEPLAKREQSVSKALADREQTVSKALAQPLAEPLAKREQSVSKALAISYKTLNYETIETLVGNEKGLLSFLFQKCQSIGSLESPAITTDDLKNILKINAVHLRNLLYRLSNKGIIKTSKLKNGKSGWRKFRLPKEIFQYLSLGQSVSKALADREQSVSKALAQPLAEPLAKPSSSSSGYIYIKETTTTGCCSNSENLPLPVGWEQLDIEPLISIGFTKTHLSQIAAQNKLTPQMTQDSIYSFAFDLQENNKAKTIKGDPINFFMGILNSGRVYTFASNYESPQDRSMRLYIENKRKIEQKRIELEKEAITLAFNEWFMTLTEEQKRKFLPEMFRSTPRLEKNKLLESSARTHFETEIWPGKRSEVMQIDKNTIEPKEVMAEETGS